MKAGPHGDIAGKQQITADQRISALPQDMRHTQGIIGPAVGRSILNICHRTIDSGRIISRTQPKQVQLIGRCGD